MTHVEEVRIESDEHGFELHLVVGEDIVVDDQGRAVLNVHGVAEQLLSEAVTKIGPWMLEGLRVQRERARTPFDEDDLEPEPGESPMDHFRRTGNPDAVLDMADHIRDRERGK